MNKYYLYLDKDIYKLVISVSELPAKNYAHLMDSTDISYCKIYALGVLAGQFFDAGKLKNDSNEFK